MAIARRRVLLGAACGVALPVIARRARAESYPARAVRLVVGFAPAGVADITSRLTAQYLSQRLGQNFVVENRTGAGGNIAAAVVVKAPPDGYTLLQIGVPIAVNPTLYGHLEFDYARDLVPAASLCRVANVLLVTPSLPIASVPELIAHAKAEPGRLTMATGGNGSTPHMFGELFKMMAGVDLTSIAYRGGGPALVDLLAGQVQVMFDPLPESISYIKAGKLRALAISSATRSPALPDVPPIGDFVPGYEATGWQGFAGPRGTPPEVIDQLHDAVNGALADPDFAARLVEVGAEPFASTQADFARFIALETEKWSKVVRAAHLTVK